MVGPYDEGYLKQEDIDMLYDTTWTIPHNAAHGRIHLIVPKAEVARSDGGRRRKTEHTQVTSLNTATRSAHSTGQAMIHASSHWTA
jgi:hypothetical protein